jgi:hypothetical protein
LPLPCATIRKADGTTERICGEEPRAQSRSHRKPKGEAALRPGERKGAVGTVTELAAAAKRRAGADRQRARGGQERGRSKPPGECVTPSDPRRRC